MMKRFLLAILAMLVASSMFALYVEIGTGTSAFEETPTNGYYNYSWSAAIYPADAIGGSYTFHTLSYYVNNASTTQMNDQHIYMTQWSLDTFSSADYPDPVTAGWTEVFSGDITWAGPGWYDIVLDGDGFEYNNMSNLLICWENRDGSYVLNGYPEFRYTNSSDTSIYCPEDDEFPNWAGTLDSARPNIRLHYDLAGAPTVVTNPSPGDSATDVPVTQELTWTFGENTETYDLYFGTTNPPTNMVANNQEAGATGSYSPDLSSSTTYFWQVVSRNSVTRLELPGPVWSFETEILPVTEYPYAEDFDGGVLPVGWVQDASDDFDWIIDSDGTPSSSTGPGGDHTTGSGYYMYIEAGDHSTGEVANLETPEFNIGSLASPKLHFWYHMYGSDMGTLNVDIWDGATWTNAWTMSGNQNDQWLDQYVDLAPYNGGRNTIKVRFQCVEVSGYTGDMAIDDVSVDNIAGLPSVASSPDPGDDTTNFDIDGTISWAWGENNATYDLWFGETGSLSQVVDGTACEGEGGSYAPSGMTYDTEYEWYVVTYNEGGQYATSPTWSFTTQPDPSMPVAAHTPGPVHGATDQPRNGDLTWMWGENSATYDLWFGQYGAATEVVTGASCGTLGSYSYENLALFDLYEWWVVTYNGSGSSVESAHWAFSTGGDPGMVNVGRGTVTGTCLPMEIYFNYTLSQSIYLQSEINMAGQQIESIAYYYNGNENWTEDDVYVYMGHTADAALTSFLPLSNFTEVYHGSFAVTTTPGWVTIPLDTPFVYNNTDNLVVMFHANTGTCGTNSAEFYGENVGANRSRYARQDGSPYDPASPPSGTSSSNIPNTVFTFGEPPANPIFAVNIDSHDFGQISVGQTSDPVTVTVSNIGGGTLAISSVMLDNTEDFNLTDLNGYPVELTAGQNMSFEVEFNPTTAGDLSGTITIVDNLTGRADHFVALSGFGWEMSFPYLETFNSMPGALPPGGWVFEDAATSLAWGTYEYGTGNVALLANYWNEDTGNYWILKTPAFDIADCAYFAFDWSHTIHNDYGELDQLIVELLDDEGSVIATLFDKIGDNLNSNDGATSTSPGSFKTETFDLTGYSGIVQVRFTAVSGYGPNLYLDNVHFIVPQMVQEDQLFFSEITDNIPGNDDGTGYIELLTTAELPVDVGGCAIHVGQTVGEVFTPNGNSYPFPAGTVMMPKSYMIVANGADLATFNAAWGTDIDQYLPGMPILNIANSGYSYMLTSPDLRAELDVTPDVPAYGALVQQDHGVWTPSTPAASTPGVYSPGQTLPVELSSFSAMVTASETVMIEWSTQSETDALGYHVLRNYSAELDGAMYITGELIEATNSTEEVIYSHEDIDVDQNTGYYYWLETIDTDGSSERFGPVFCSITPTDPGVPEFYEVTRLSQNSPNPFNPTTEIRFDLRGEAGTMVNAELAIYNIRGQRVRTLISGAAETGPHTITWHGDDDHGRNVGSGVYFYKLTASGFSQINKMMLLK